MAKIAGAEAMSVLVERFPQAFSLKQPRPLKIGIYDDLIAAQTALSPEEIKAGIACYCGRPAYLNTLRVGAPRVDLSGNPTDHSVTPGQAYHAKEKFWRWRRRER